MSLSVWSASVQAHRVYKCEHQTMISYQDKACRSPEVQTEFIDFDFQTADCTTAPADNTHRSARRSSKQQLVSDRRFDKRMQALKAFEENQARLRQTPSISDEERLFLQRDQIRLQAQLDHYQ